MGTVLWRGFSAALLLFVVVLSQGCGASGVERVDVTWETDPPPKWGLYPGYRQEIPCPAGASYRVDVFAKGRAFTSGTVRNAGYALRFEPAKPGLEAEGEGDRLALVAQLPGEQGAAGRRTALTIERNGEKIIFSVPK